MTHAQSSAGKPWQGRLLQPFLHFHDAIEHTPARRAQVRLLAFCGALGMPLYYTLWHYYFPQEYESPALRVMAALMFAAGPVSSPLQQYLVQRLPVRRPDLRTAVFLYPDVFDEPCVDLVELHSLLVALVVLFHFDTRIAVLAYLSGTLLACAVFAVLGDAAFPARHAGAAAIAGALVYHRRAVAGQGQPPCGGAGKTGRPGRWPGQRGARTAHAAGQRRGQCARPAALAAAPCRRADAAPKPTALPPARTRWRASSSKCAICTT